VNLESEDEETMERVASPMVVETISDLIDAGVATCSTDIGVNNQLSLTSAAKPDRVEKIVTVRVELPSVPGPFSGEVSVYFSFPYPVVYILLLNSGV
jgi:hypothetical protein